MTGVELTALIGLNPLGLFAALGALDVATRTLPERTVTLHWSDELEPVAHLSGVESIDELVELCDRDRERWRRSPVLTWGPDGEPLNDLKHELDVIRRWIEATLEVATPDDRADIDLLGALVAEGAVAGKGDSKPTHFHFTAGQQQFLKMVRELRDGIDADRLREALVGPWRYDSELPVLGWDARGERIFALRGFNPSNEKKSGVPGADWLAFLGLRFFPVSVRQGQLYTTGCAGTWKDGTFTWPLWSVPLTAPVVASLLADAGIRRLDDRARAALGIHRLLRSPIRRSDQGGRGSFGPAEPVRPQVEARNRARSRAARAVART